MWNASSTIDLTLDEESHSGSETIGTSSSSSEEADESSVARMPAKRSTRRLEPEELDAFSDKKKCSSVAVIERRSGSEKAAVAAMRKLTNSKESCDDDSTDRDDSEPPPPKKRKRKKKRSSRPMEETDSGSDIIETSSSDEEMEESWVAGMLNNKRSSVAFQPRTLDAHPGKKKRSNMTVRKQIGGSKRADVIKRKSTSSEESCDDDSTSSDDSEAPPPKKRKRKEMRSNPMEETDSGSQIIETSSSSEEAEETWVARLPNNKRRSHAFQPGTLDAHPGKKKRSNVAVRKREGGSKRAAVVKRKLTSSKESFDDDSTGSDDSEAAPRKKRKQKKKKSKHEPQKDLQTYGDYVLQFQDDETGRKQIQPSAMRYFIKLMEKEASRATESVAQSLLEDGEVAESRKVQARSSNHVEEIMSRARRYLAVAMIPKDYIRGEDLIAVDLERTNAQRQKKIEEKKKISKQLVQQRKLLKKEKDKAKARRDHLQNQLNALKAQLSADDSCGSSIQMLLRNQSDTGLSATASSEPRPLYRSTLTSVSKDAMNKLLSEVPSPYD